MATINRFEDIQAWQHARILCKKIYDISDTGSFAKDFSLRNQIRRSAGSSMDNIAEGYGRGGNKEFINFLSISMGSTNEVQSQLYRALDVGHIKESEFENLFELAEKVARKTNAFIKYLKESEMKGPKFKEQRTKNKEQ